VTRRPSIPERRRRVHEAWERIEDNEPDISTERLMAMVADDTDEDYGDVAWLIGDEGDAP
jgi:hypothetical protein